MMAIFTIVVAISAALKMSQRQQNALQTAAVMITYYFMRTTVLVVQKLVRK